MSCVSEGFEPHAAVIALSQWKFKPATLDGVPVDVIFNLTMSSS